MRGIGTALAAVATAGALVATAAPAHAIEVCDPNRFLCVEVLDSDTFGCPGGYQQIARIPNPNGGSVVLVCALR